MGRVVLTVNNLDQLSAFYEKIVGLHVLRRDGETAELGVGGSVLLELRQDNAARRRSMIEAGLFHTAFLLPTRADLARWTRNAIGNRFSIDGASDHLVSEAFYLSDPEGNGVEIYVDRPPSQWRWRDGEVAMSTEPLDVADLVAAAGEGLWRGFPDGSTVGHVHLQVGALAPAEAFYKEVIRLDVTARYPGAIFYSADRYHHHIATNTWNSLDAPSRGFPSTGLTEMEIVFDPARAKAVLDRATGDAGRLALTEPWGTPVVLIVR